MLLAEKDVEAGVISSGYHSQLSLLLGLDSKLLLLPSLRVTQLQSKLELDVEVLSPQYHSQLSLMLDVEILSRQSKLVVEEKNVEAEVVSPQYHSQFSSLLVVGSKLLLLLMLLVDALHSKLALDVEVLSRQLLLLRDSRQSKVMLDVDKVSLQSQLLVREGVEVCSV